MDKISTAYVVLEFLLLVAIFVPDWSVPQLNDIGGIGLFVMGLGATITVAAWGKTL